MDSSKINGNAGLNDSSGNEVSRDHTPVNGSATPVCNGIVGPSRLAQSSAADLDMLSGNGTSFRGAYEQEFFHDVEYRQARHNNGSTAKRKRVSTPDNGGGQGGHSQSGSAPQRVASRDLMPPPAIPFRNRGPPSPMVSDIRTQPYHMQLQRGKVIPTEYQNSNHFELSARAEEEAAHFRWHDRHAQHPDYRDQTDQRLSDALIFLPQARGPYNEDANRPFIYDRPSASAHIDSGPTNGTFIDTASHQPYITPMRTPSRARAPVSVSNNPREPFNFRPFYYGGNNTRPPDDGELDQYRTTTQPPATSPVCNRITRPPPPPRHGGHGGGA